MAMRINEVPRRYINAVIEPDNLEQWHPEVYDVCARFLRGFRQCQEEGKAPCLLGPSGIGKTYGIAAVTRFLAEKIQSQPGTEFTYLWVPTSEAFDNLTAHRDFRSAAYWKFDNLLKTADWVVFDDIGYLRDYPRYQELLWLYLNHRCDERKMTAFTGQLSIETLDDLIPVFGDGIVRRLDAMCGGLITAIPEG
jgi:DNA replication protein DnaC